jgi:hypothetical protein
MSGGIYLIQDDGKLVEMKQQAYDSEALLQRLLSEYPNLLAGDQIDPMSPRRWLLISREVAVPSEEGGSGRWALDHLFLDQDGVPTLVEVKRSSDTRIRREVVGQMLDYAANAKLYWPVESIQEWLEKTCELQGRDSDEALRELVGQEMDIPAFWQTVKTNLQAGRVRLLFVADEIPPELQRVVEFLSNQMKMAEVFAVEVRQFVGQGSLTTLIPRLIGQTADKTPATLEGGKPWDEDRFFRKMQETQTPAEIEVARKLLDWATISPNYVWWGRGRLSGSFVAEIDLKDRYYQLFNATTGGKIYLPFATYQRRSPFESEDKRRELLRQFNSFLNAKIPETAIDKYPGFPLAELTEAGKLDQFLKTFEWFVEQVKAT